MRRSKRICVRLEQERQGRLQQYCEETGYDVSRVVRLALDAYLDREAGPVANGTPQRRLSPPEQVFPHMPKYRAWGAGDLREERKRLYKELVAAAFVCKQHYQRTPCMLEGYEGLLQLRQFFGVG